MTRANVRSPHRASVGLVPRARGSRAVMAGKSGRPTLYTPEVADTILEQVAAGRPLVKICRASKMPAYRTVREWIADDREGFRARYAAAKEDQADYLADELLMIADAAVKCKTPEQIAAARLRVDVRKFSAAKLKPRVYGDSNHVKVSAPDGGPVQMEAVVNVEAGEAYLRMLNGRPAA